NSFGETDSLALAVLKEFGDLHLYLRK
ncbi:MAG: hypothetical protein RLZZ387_5525, partial [Chloroflexota bacterium]